MKISATANQAEQIAAAVTAAAYLFRRHFFAFFPAKEYIEINGRQHETLFHKQLWGTGKG
jgi:hypothetical protein